MNNDNSRGGIFALLDSPVGSNISIDGKSLILKQDNFVGFASLKSFGFHLITFQAFQSRSHENGCGSSRHAIVLLRTHVDNGTNWISAHRYDPTIEEINPSPLDKLTILNLENSIRSNQLGPPSVICSSALFSETELNEWLQATTFISESLFQSRGIFHGCKIVPGAFQEDTSKMKINHGSLSHVDGTELHYPPIPILGGTLNKWCRHNGTKKYLASLNPSQRTDFLVKNQINSSAIALVDQILEEYYNNQWKELLGDVQLSYIMFMHLQCLSSLEHWRDLIAMLSFVPVSRLEANSELYYNLVNIITLQMKYIDQEIFEELDFTEGNFFLPAAKRLIATMKECNIDRLKEKSKQFEGSFRSLTSTNMNSHFSRCEDHLSFTPCSDDSENDDDGPTVVSAEEYDASLERSAQGREEKVATLPIYPLEHRREYAILFASMQPHEDILMTCARALDTQSDVSLVREAAKYLEEVESKNPSNSAVL